MGSNSLLAQELSKFYEAAWLNLPVVVGKMLMGAADEKELQRAGWNVYDAWISVANEVTNAIYSDRVVGEFTGHLMEWTLRMRQISGAMATAFFGNLWPLIGLPTQSEMIALRDELLMLREELAAYAASQPILEDAAEKDEGDALRRIPKGVRSYGFGVMNGNGHAVRVDRQRKRNAVAE
jgi:hypothetical protein